MKLITVAGPPSCGKTSVLLHVLRRLKSIGVSCGVVKFDCLSSADEEAYLQSGVTAVTGLAGGQCPDHFYAANIHGVFKWGIEKGFDCLITESAGLCNRCSPYLKGVPSVCVIDNLAGMWAPAKIGPLLRFADIVAITKGDIVSQAEREVFAFRVQQLAPQAEIFQINGISGQGTMRLADRLAESPDFLAAKDAVLRFPMPSAICSYCIGETRIDREYLRGNAVLMFGDNLPPFDPSRVFQSVPLPSNVDGDSKNRDVEEVFHGRC